MAQLQAISMSQTGRNRGVNEDCFLIGGYVPDHFALESTGRGSLDHQWTAAVKETACLAVFDGTSDGSPAETAAWMAAEELKSEVSRLALLPLTLVDALMQRFINRTHNRIWQASQSDVSLKGLGTTFACLCVRANQAAVYTFGDCRAYLHRHSQIRPLARDSAKPIGNTSVQMDVTQSPSKSTRYLGMPAQAKPLACESSGPITLQDQDCFLLCSSSLTETLDDATIQSCLEIINPRDAAAQLITLAREHGCLKSITLIVARWFEVEPVRQTRIADPSVQSHPRQPNPRIEHEHQVFKIPDDKPKIKQESFKIVHFDFWQNIPFWLQILNLIALLGLILFLVWLLNPGLFG